MKAKGIDSKLTRKSYTVTIEGNVHTAITSSGKSKLIYRSDDNGIVKEIEAHRHDEKVETLTTVGAAIHYLSGKLTDAEKTRLAKVKDLKDRRSKRAATTARRLAKRVERVRRSDEMTGTSYALSIGK